MADPKPQGQEQSEAKLPASQAPQDYHAVLMKVINDVTNDHTLLRKLVYTLAWHNLRPEAIVTRPIPDVQTQAKTIFELGQAIEFEKAIERVEAEAIGQGPKQISRPRAFDNPQPTLPEPTPPSGADTAPINDADLAALADRISNTDRPPESPIATVSVADASFEPPIGRNVVPLTEQRAWPERKDVVTPERIPSWLDPSGRVSLDSVEYAPIQHSYLGRSNFASFTQLIAASVIGVVLCIGIFGWVYLGRQSASVSGTADVSSPQAVVNPSSKQGTAIQAQNPVGRPLLEPQPIQSQRQPILPFPLPRTYGVYAGSPGQLFELDQLPIKVPDPRVLASAEITKSSGPPIPGENLSFVVFRRDLVNSTPQVANVRVVAQVQRTTKFINGKPAIVPLEGVWRIRNKAYEFKISPLEGHNEMVVIQPNPGFVFPPGRYALVLNGFGYDFTVAGAITAPEQCLEQVEVMNGAVLAECPKS